MKQNWELKKFSEICGFVRGPFGGSLKKNIFKEDGYAVYEQQHAIYNQFKDIRYFVDETKYNEMKRFELFPGDLIMSCSGTMGKVAIVPNEIKKGIINQALLKLTPSKKVDAIFLKLWMQSESFQESLSKYSQGAAIQNIASVAILKNIEIPLPPLQEQQRIVAILDEAFRAIDKAKANTEQNLKNASELFESELQRVFSEKGDGWEEKTLGEVIEIRNGKNQSSVISKSGKYKIMGSAGNVMGFATDYICEEGTTIIGRKGNISKPLYIEEKFWNVDTAFGLYPKNNLNKKLVYYICLTIDFAGMNRGTTIPSLVKSELLKLNIFIPTEKDQQKIVSKLDALREQTKKLEAVYEKKLQDLEELKKSVLSKAFSGEL